MARRDRNDLQQCKQGGLIHKRHDEKARRVSVALPYYVVFEEFGRKSDIVISGGFNIYAREIEELRLDQPGVCKAQ